MRPSGTWTDKLSSRCFLIAVTASLSSFGCNVDAPPPSLAPVKAEQGVNPPLSGTIKAGSDTPSDKLMAYDAWRRFVEGGRYRAAGASDFRFSAAAIEKGGIDLRRWAEFPIVNGVFNEDHKARDAAIIVVDMARNDPERFGVIIFHDIDDPSTPYQPHWLYRERDLSETVLGWSRDGLSLREYREDGTSTLCRVRWDKQRKEYTCR